MTRGEKLKELINQELGDYSYFEGWRVELYEEYENYNYYYLYVKNSNARFKVWDDKIEVELSEGVFEEIEHFDWTIKYFWMAILSWD